MKRLLRTLYVYSLIISYLSCYYNEFPEEDEFLIPPDQEASFTNNIIPIFSIYSCSECHDVNGVNPNLLPGEAYNALVPVYVTPFKPEESRLYTFLVDRDHRNINNESKAWIKKWIEDGAKNN